MPCGFCIFRHHFDGSERNLAFGKGVKNMRIISQDGRFDLPYELVAISTHNIHQEQVIAKPIASTTKLYCVMGEYSTKEKAVKAMEMLREEYKTYLRERCSGAFFIFVEPKVFQFPPDSEV